MEKRSVALFCAHLYSLNRTNCKSCGKSASSDSQFNVGKNNQNIHFMNLHVKKLEKLLLF
ncbi:hypothetical protein SEEC5569_25740 [Salmonella enterica subsp. enterica serovar Cerro str. 5569]|nr:hypothetical protein SEEC5569_25740 [Salmonella enterica subsp. enterica serovar Cerro str. 5569]